MSTARKRVGGEEPYQPLSKRRKPSNDDGTPAESDPAAQEASVKAYMFHATKLLLKALKKSGAFEAQKVARKLKTSREPKDGVSPEVAVLADLEATLAAIKSLDLNAISNHLLLTRLPKITLLHPILPSVFASLPSPATLPVLADAKSPEAKARNRVLANKVVKEAWDEVARAVGKRMGEIQEEVVVIEPEIKAPSKISTTPVVIAEPVAVVEGKRLSKRAERAAKGAAKALLPRKVITMDPARKAAILEAESALNNQDDSGSEEEEGYSGSDDEDEEELRREMARLGGDSGSDSDGEGFSSDDYGAGGEQASSDDDDDSLRPTPTAKSSKSAATVAPASKKVPAKKSTKPITSSSFLPSLAGGYISYSDSDGEDAKWVKESEKSDKVERKNRRGQRARQAIWEQKYGSGANHIVKTTGDVAAPTKGGKANRGAPTKSTFKSSSTKTGAPVEERINPRHAAFDPSTTRPGAEFNPNTQPILERKASKVEVGMHPSWEAKRKQKEALENLATAPKGKKITFA